VTDRIDEYRSKRDARRTPEPIPRAGQDSAGQDSAQAGSGRFVIHQHHARSLHWDVRLERDGVLVSFAVPRGLPRDRGRNNLAVHTEDHPLEYIDFSGVIPEGEYGGGTMTVHDSGSYVADKWRDDEVAVTFSGGRTSGRYVFFRTDGRDWMVRRMDPPPAGWQTMPEAVAPMLATRAAGLPPDDHEWGYEMSWGGLRAQAFVSGGRLRLLGADRLDITSTYPELRAMAPALAPTEVVLDGEIVAFDGTVPSPDLLARRAAPRDSAAARRAADRNPVQFLAYDLLWLEGNSTVGAVRYTERRELLEGLAVAGPNWQTPPHFAGGGEFAAQAARAQGLDGIVAKRLDSPYLPGRRSRLWLSIGA
jgi:bifunctional non-homologous end joining protein LigD